MRYDGGVGGGEVDVGPGGVEAITTAEVEVVYSLVTGGKNS